MIIIGTGSYNLDTIVQREYPDGFVPGRRNKFVERVVRQEIGSNPGNVMCIMSHLGWHSCPIALFDDSPEGHQMTADFQRYGCDTRYVTNTPDGGTNLLRITHALNPEGQPVCRFSRRHAPGSGFPRDKAFTIQGPGATLPRFVEQIEALPAVYFFEGTAPAWRELGRWMRQRGVLVYYEMQHMHPRKLRQYQRCIAVSDIVKFSDEAINDLSLVDGYTDKLIVQTLGAQGVRFNLRGQGWVTLPPVLCPNVVDTEGCGDWTTAALINALGQRSALDVATFTSDIVSDCLMEAQTYASRNASYLGTKALISNP